MITQVKGIFSTKTCSQTKPSGKFLFTGAPYHISVPYRYPRLTTMTLNHMGIFGVNSLETYSKNSDNTYIICTTCPRRLLVRGSYEHVDYKP